MQSSVWPAGSFHPFPSTPGNLNTGLLEGPVSQWLQTVICNSKQNIGK